VRASGESLCAGSADWAKTGNPTVKNSNAIELFRRTIFLGSF
jgi:hypothetical protein